MPEREILRLISPSISHQVLHLLREAQLGISSSSVRISDLNTRFVTDTLIYGTPLANRVDPDETAPTGAVSSGSTLFANMSNHVTMSCPTVTCQDGGICDRFKVGIQFAGQTLIWEVLFDCNYPEDPPDFIFEDVDFFPDINKMPALVDWDYRDPSSLLRVIEQLLDQYRQHQERVVSRLSRLSFEYSSLIKDTDTESDDVEIHIAKSSENRVGPINFLIKLHVDFSRIPAYIVRLGPGEDIAILLVTFNTADGTRITPQLYLSPRVERALGGPANLRIPGFPLGTCLMEYVPEVTSLLKNKVDQIVQCYEKRKEYIAAFLSIYGRSVLEYDAEGFTKTSFLFEWNDFFFMVIIELPAFFPKGLPIISLQSIYHEHKGKPYTETFQEYPYSPRWSGLEMADRTRSLILEKIGNFQRASVQTCAT